MRRNASSASKGSHRRQHRRILKETALIYPKIIMVIIMQPHRWDKTLRWREMDSNLRFPNRSAPVFRDSSPVSHGCCRDLCWKLMARSPSDEDTGSGSEVN